MTSPLRQQIQSVFKFYSDKPLNDYLLVMDKMGIVDDTKLLKVIAILAEHLDKLEQKPEL